MKYSTQMINTTNHKPGADQMNPRKNYIFKIGLLALCSIFSSAVYAEFAPDWDAGLTFTTDSGSFTQPVGAFPETNLKFYPGIIIWSSEDESPSSIESNWQALFTSEKNRKETYRPPGIYGGVTAKLKWSRYYKDTNVRPDDPKNHKDPAYNWNKIDAIFNINAVQNEGALVVIQVGEGGTGTPNWLVNTPYNGVFTTGIDGGSGKERKAPKYYRYTGPDNRGEPGASPSEPAIVEELVNFHKALRDHLEDTGNLDKVMFLTLGEIFVNASNLPNDFDRTKLEHGLGVRNTKIAEIWAANRTAVLQSSMVGPNAPTLWEYMDNPSLGLTFPDMKMSGTNNFSGAGRFTHPDGTDQKDVRPLSQSIEGNGFKANTYFSPDIPNPWGYSDKKVPQTMSHVLWALSGPPKGENKDSGLGQSGDDPQGVMPVHNIMVSWSMTWENLNPSLSEWHEAFDTFGPAGTFAFPYLPVGYEP